MRQKGELRWITFKWPALQRKSKEVILSNFVCRYGYRNDVTNIRMDYVDFKDKCWTMPLEDFKKAYKFPEYSDWYIVLRGKEKPENNNFNGCNLTILWLWMDKKNDFLAGLSGIYKIEYKIEKWNFHLKIKVGWNLVFVLNQWPIIWE